MILTENILDIESVEIKEQEKDIKAWQGKRETAYWKQEDATVS